MLDYHTLEFFKILYKNQNPVHFGNTKIHGDRAIQNLPVWSHFALEREKTNKCFLLKLTKSYGKFCMRIPKN
jgi:hypothetical protein